MLNSHVRAKDKPAEAAPAVKPAEAEALNPALAGIVELQRLIGNRLVQRVTPARPLLSIAVGGNNPEVTRELQRLLNQAGVRPPEGNAAHSELPLAEDGIFGPKTREAVRAFQREYGLPVDGVVGARTWAALDAPVTRVDAPFNETVGGIVYRVPKCFDWRVTPEQVHVTVRIQFTGANLPAVVNRWFGAIRATWNRFKVVNPATGQALDIAFEPQNSGGDPHHVVEIIDALGRSNAAQWYTQDAGGDADNNRMAAHEFGHMIGLADEYQLTHGDFQATVGAEPPAGETTGDAPAADIAAELRTALAEADEDDRVTAVRAVVTGHSLQQGDFAEEIVTAYNSGGDDLVHDLATLIPASEQWALIDPFTHSTSSIMGNFYLVPADAHDHPVEARHMRQFADFAKQERGGIWEARPR